VLRIINGFMYYLARKMGLVKVCACSLSTPVLSTALSTALLTDDCKLLLLEDVGDSLSLTKITLVASCRTQKRAYLMCAAMMLQYTTGLLNLWSCTA
jgi:hypothetical protein